MAELKPVPSGYDASALSSMLGYLANARKSHDNNPFMRTILDQQARDNKQEYLADADLTRQSQMDDNEYVRQMNMAALLQKDASERASRASSMFNATDGAVRTAPLTNDQGMSAQAPQEMDDILNSLGLDKMLDPVKKRSEIRKNNADTENTLISAVKGRANVGDTRPIANIHDLPDDVNIDPENSLRVRASAATGRDAVVKTNTEEEGTQGFSYSLRVRDPATGEVVEKPLTNSEALALKGTPQERDLVSRTGKINTTNQTRTTSKGGEGGKVSLADPMKDVEAATSAAKAQGLQVEGSGQDANGAYVIVKGQRLYPRPRQQ